MPTPLALTSAPTPTFGRRSLSAGIYRLNHKLMESIPMKLNGRDSSFWQVYLALSNAKIKDVDILGNRYETETGNVFLLDGKEEYAIKSAMKVLAEVIKLGANPYTAAWFYFGKDHSRDADEIQEFFVVYEDKIIGTFHFDCRSPQILVKPEEKDEEYIWSSDRYFREASEIYWYRKFYTETMIGQLMVLRPDEPPLYFYNRSVSFEPTDAEAVKAKPPSKWRTALRLIGLFVCGSLLTVYTALVVATLWNWFVAPSLHATEISLWQAFGLIFLAGLVKSHLGDVEQHNRWHIVQLTLAACVPESKERQLKQQLEDAPGYFTMILMRAAGATAALALGWLFHSL
jgi:hypothetical protein